MQTTVLQVTGYCVDAYKREVWKKRGAIPQAPRLENGTCVLCSHVGCVLQVDI